MNVDNPILFVSAGLLHPKKQDHLIARHHRYLNYGLLGLATIVSEAGYSAWVVHGHFDDPDEFLHRLESGGWLVGTFPVFLSLPSSFAIGWAQRFACSLRKLHPKKQIVVGGRWVVGNDGEWIRAQIPEADLVIFGTAENKILSLLSPHNWTKVSEIDRCSQGETASPDGLGPHLKYQLLDRLDEFQPSIEVSRGCGMGCFFLRRKGSVNQPAKVAEGNRHNR